MVFFPSFRLSPLTCGGDRPTINGIDVAPRSELSPPAVASSDAAVDGGEEPGRKKLLGKFGKASSSAVNKVSSGDSFFVEGSVSRKGTLARISSKLREKKQRQGVLRKSSSDITNFNKAAADSINDSLGSSNSASAGASPGGPSTPIGTSGTIRSLPPSQSPPTPEPLRNAHDLFRFILEHALDPDQKVLQSYVFTLAYFTDPVHVLSDLITEHDVSMAAATGAKQADAEGEEVAVPGAERAMKVISFWVSHLWYQFEGSEPLMNLLTHFVKVNLKGRRWGKRLSDTIDALVEGRKALTRTLESIVAHAKLATKEDVFAEIDPDDQEEIDPGQGEADVDDDEEEEEYEVVRSNDDDVMPAEDVTATFVGAETYTNKSKPMGLADLLGEMTLDVEKPKASATSGGAGGGGGKKENVQSTLVGAHKYNPSSRPMGLFGLLDDAEENEKSIWDVGRADPAAPLSARSLSFADESKGPTIVVRTTTRASDVARQLTLIEFVHWKMVSPLEMQRAIWKNEGEEKAHYIRQVISWHNRIAAWVQYEILSRGTSVADRVIAVQRFIAICLHLERLQNYHSLFGIMAGLKVGSVARLRVEQDLPGSWRKILNRLMELASTRNNWELYRAAKSRATKFPFFPFLGVYLQDLQVLEAKEKTFVGEDPSTKLINFGKMRKLGELLMELVYVQRGSEYGFRHNPRIMSYLLALKQLSDDELWDMSCRIVPVAGDFEHHARASDKSFLAATLSPRSGQALLSPSAAAGLSNSGATGRQRSASIGDSFRKWKPRQDSDPSSRPPSKSGTASPRQQSPRSPRSMSTSGTSPRPSASEMLPCPLCSAMCAGKAKLVDHLSRRLCTALKQHTCPVCESQFPNKEELVPHVNSRKCSPRPTTGQMACPICDYKLTSAAELRAHIYSRVCLPSTSANNN
jgi:hypothetical protein